jgi:hypothetical protein
MLTAALRGVKNRFRFVVCQLSDQPDFRWREPLKRSGIDFAMLSLIGAGTF